MGAKNTPGPWFSELWSPAESLIYAVVDGRKIHVTLTCVNEDAALIAAAPDLLEAVKVIAQALLEVQAAQQQGAEWYTKGASGLYQQVAMHVQKGREAAKAAVAKATGSAS